MPARRLRSIKKTPKAVVVNISKKEKFDVYVGRTGLGFVSEFGNPYRIGRDGSRKDVIDKFKKYFLNRLTTDKQFREQVELLKGQRLGCFCKPRDCHGDIIAAYLNQD